MKSHEVLLHISGNPPTRPCENNLCLLFLRTGVQEADQAFSPFARNADLPPKGNGTGCCRLLSPFRNVEAHVLAGKIDSDVVLAIWLDGIPSRDISASQIIPFIFLVRRPI